MFHNLILFIEDFVEMMPPVPASEDSKQAPPLPVSNPPPAVPAKPKANRTSPTSAEAPKKPNFTKTGIKGVGVKAKACNIKHVLLLLLVAANKQSFMSMAISCE